MSSPVHNTKLLCEDCEYSLECVEINPYTCGNKFAQTVNTNFNMEAQYSMEDTAIIY
jgi:hypothetical protein